MWRLKYNFSIFNPGLGGAKRTTSRQCCIIPRKIVFFTHGLGRWVGSNTNLNTVEKIKKKNPSVVHPVAELNAGGT
jgi:hypothetical protein